MKGDREKLVELLSEVQYLGGLEEKIADHLIANGVTVNKWISVKERMPESEKILAINESVGLVDMKVKFRRNADI